MYISYIYIHVYIHLYTYRYTFMISPYDIYVHPDMSIFVCIHIYTHSYESYRCVCITCFDSPTTEDICVSNLAPSGRISSWHCWYRPPTCWGRIFLSSTACWWLTKFPTDPNVLRGRTNIVFVCQVCLLQLVWTSQLFATMLVRVLRVKHELEMLMSPSIKL